MRIHMVGYRGSSIQSGATTITIRCRRCYYGPWIGNLFESECVCISMYLCMFHVFMYVCIHACVTGAVAVTMGPGLEICLRVSLCEFLSMYVCIYVCMHASQMLLLFTNGLDWKSV